MSNILEQFEIEEVKQEHEGFHIDNMESANWAFRKIKAYLSKKAEIEALAKAEIDRINEWKTKELEGISNSIGFFEGKLIEYGLTQREQDPKFKCSTPYGKIGFRKQQPKWEYQDEVILNSLKASGLNEFIRIKEEVNKTDLKKAVNIVNGMAVTSTGEILEGITVIEQEEKCEVKVVD